MDIDIHQIPDDLNLSVDQLETIILNTCREIQLSALSISYVFVSDNELAEMHTTFLDNNSRTDILTFNLGENEVEGEIYISKDRAKDHAAKYKVSYEAEIIRLLVHGMLHLAGYDDIEEVNRKKMKLEENRLVDKMLTLLTP